jgi:hypothetical protein
VLINGPAGITLPIAGREQTGVRGSRTEIEAKDLLVFGKGQIEKRTGVGFRRSNSEQIGDDCATPRRPSKNPSATRRPKAVVTVCRDTPRVPASSRLGGRRSPGSSRPSRIPRRISS